MFKLLLSRGTVMNKIYQTKFNKLTGTTVVCSELVKRACKVTATVSFLAASTTAFADDCTPDANGSYLVGDNNGVNSSCNNIGATTVKQSGNAEFYILTRSKLHDTLEVGETVLNANVTGSYTGLGNQYSYEHNGAKIEAGNLNFTINGNGNIQGISSHSGVNITAKDVELNITDNYTSGNNSSDGVASYGILAGSSVNSSETNSTRDKYTTIKVNRLKINQTTKGKGGKATPILNNGIRVIQGAANGRQGEGSAGKVIVNDDLDMTLIGNRAIGIYVSGNKNNHGDAESRGPNGELTPIVILNGKDNRIIIQKGDELNNLQWDSSAVKLGKVRNTGSGAGILESHGKLEIDTTNALHGGGIKMLRNSVLKADYDGSSTIINTNGYALEIGTHDDRNSSGKFEQAASKNVMASFKNAKFTTTGTSMDPNVNGSVGRKDLIFVDQGQVNTVLNFSGDETNLTANDNGYILNVSGNYTAAGYDFLSNTYDNVGNEKGHEDYQASSVTFNAYDKGSMTGLVSKGTVKTEENQKTDNSVGEPTLNLNLSNGFTWNLKKNGSENTAKFNKLTLSNGAVLNAAWDDNGGNNFILEGDVENKGGIISLDNKNHAKYDDHLTIIGDYIGSDDGSSVVKMNTLWNAPGGEDGENSESDKLTILGNAFGVTHVVAVNKDGNENIIDGNVKQVEHILNTIPVINVSVHDDHMAFQGTAKTSGAIEVQLAKRQSSNGDDYYYWTMEARRKDPGDTGGGDTGGGDTGGGDTGGGDTGGGDTGGGSGKDPGGTGKVIYANAVAGYVAMPRVNQEQGFASVGTLHERRGAYLNADAENCSNCENQSDKFIHGQTWSRIYGKHLKQDGKDRLNLDTDIAGIQIGHDFLNKFNDNGSHNHTGVYIAYSRGNTDFSDEYHSENGLISADKYTGKGKSDAVSVGITNTFYMPNNSYVDLVGQVSYLHNKYEARDGNNPDSQDGWGVALSAEAGRAFELGKSASDTGSWKIEPQAQLVYQYINLDSFNDKYRHIDQNGQDALRGRVGVRLGYDEVNANASSVNFYAIGNIWYDFINPGNVDIGKDSLREKYAKTWGEVGLGLKVAIPKNSFINGDVRYEHDFGSTKRKGFRGNLSVEHKW